MKRMTCFVMALALVLGLAQCKKEQLKPENEGEQVMITLDVKGDNNAKADVDPPHVTFEDGDEIVVTCNGHYVGTLIKTTENGVSKFRGSITNPTEGKPLYFYFFGNASPQYFGENKYNCTVYIGEQTGELPVISMGPSIDSEGNIVTYASGMTSFTARLHNKCSLMKFNVTTDTDKPIFINGMNNFVNIDFTKAANDGEYNGFSYSQVYNGEIKMKGQEGSGTKTYWAIVLPQAYVAEGGAYTKDYSYIGARPAIEGGIGLNQYFSDGVDMLLSQYDPLGTPLTFEAKEENTTVSFNKLGQVPPSINSLEISTDGINWDDYTLGEEIILTNVGDKVMFRGTNTSYATDQSSYYKFSIDEEGYCYVYGNIMSLIVSIGYANLKSFDSNADYIFESLFADCTGLYAHPQMPLMLPATGLAEYCYSYMFQNCTNLTVAPKLPTGEDPADNLKEGCYQGMFEGCEGMEESPVLPALMLTKNCYSSMFSGCSSLSRVTCLATTTGGAYTSNWLSDVAAHGTFIKASGASWSTGDSGIPDDWSVENY